MPRARSTPCSSGSARSRCWWAGSGWPTSWSYQFLSEAILLTAAGGAAGVVLGVVSTAVYAHAKGWVIVIPPEAWAGALGAAVLIGALAGLLPAIRASRLSPTQARGVNAGGGG